MPTIQKKYAAGAPRVQRPDGFKSNSSGMVLVVVVILAAVAGILAAGLHFASGSRITQVRQEMRFEKAFFVAEAGLERAKDELRYRATNLNGVLIGNDGLTNTADDGMLSFCPANGTIYGEGRFYIRVRNNTNNPSLFVNTNYIVIIRTTGIVETAMRVIEAEILVRPRDNPITNMANLTGTALGIYGTNTDLTVSGNGKIDGHDWNLPEDFYKTQGANGNGTLSTNTPGPGVLYSSTTTVITADSSAIAGHPPITNAPGVYSETDWYDILNTAMSVATIYANDGVLGTRTAPAITMLPSGTTTIAGNIEGAGILIIPGYASLRITGTFYFEGLVILEGNGMIDADSEFAELGTARIFGAMVCVGGGLDITATGTADIKYSTQALISLASITNWPEPPPTPILQNYWKEIKAASTN